MKLDARTSATGQPLRPYGQNWLNRLDLGSREREDISGTWVQLRERPHPYSYDEALLLCPHSEGEWVVWIPDHGEMVLHECQFV